MVPGAKHMKPRAKAPRSIRGEGWVVEKDASVCEDQRVRVVATQLTHIARHLVGPATSSDCRGQSFVVF